MAETVYTSDIYDIADTMNTLQKNFMEDISEDTLAMSMFGYLNDAFSKTIQNSIIMTSEWGNESLPIKSKFEKTILTNAISYDIANINAVPSEMKVMIGFIENQLVSHMVDDKFTLAKDCELQIGDFVFHLDYDIIVSRQELKGSYIYTSIYDMSTPNPLSTISNPYMEPPIQLSINNDKFIFITCIIRQVELDTVYKKIITDNILECKTFDFEFDKQLAGFDVNVNYNGKNINLLPVFEGMPPSNTDLYCYYNYLDTTTIRIKFDKDSYQPPLNSEISVIIKTTQGENGNFTYTQDSTVALTSSIVDYNNLSVLIKTISSSYDGLDRKSVNELKLIIPKEILARGNITNNKDIQNYFNMISDNNKLLFYKRRDNQFERLYYAYLLAKDEDDNIIPTNTIDILVDSGKFTTDDDNRFTIAPGNLVSIGLDGNGYIDNELTELDNNFLYSSPFYITVDENTGVVSYYLDVLNSTYDFKFSYINSNSFVQFISTYMDIKKVYLTDKNKYKINMNITQNVNIDKGLITVDSDGNIIECKIKPALVLNLPHKYYIFGKVISYDPSSFSYAVEFELESDADINNDNEIKINNILLGGTGENTHSYIGSSVSMSVYMYAKFDTEYGRSDSDSIVAGMEGYTLCNKYDTTSNVSLFYNYSNIIQSTSVLTGTSDNGYIYKIKGVPLVRNSYITDETRCLNLIEYIQHRKAYIDSCLSSLEIGFSVDLKFFNTYGPSKLFTVGYDGTPLDRVNISLSFKTKLKTGADKYIADKMIKTIKEYMEDINELTSRHINLLITKLQESYSSDIEFVELIGMNGYIPSIQYIQKMESGVLDIVPEFLNINLKNGTEPDINIITL